MNLLLSGGFLSTTLFIILAIFILLFMVLIHELGHYLVGRWLGFEITEFSIGFGKAIWQKKNKRGELISLRIFPLGGYCAFAGEDEEEESKKSKKEKSKTEEITEDIAEIAKVDQIKIEQKKGKEFLDHKPWKRTLVFLAGITFNMLSAFVFAFILLVSYGYDIQKVDVLDANYAAQYGQLQEGDVIWKVDGEKVNFAFSGTLPQILSSKGANKDIELSVKRDGKKEIVVITLIEEVVLDDDGNPVLVDGEEQTQLVSGFKTSSYRHNFWEALSRCFEIAFGFAFAVLRGFWQILTGQISISQLGGPITTISLMADVSSAGFVNVLILLPLLAANLAIFNLLPLPALDGSHVVFTTLEWIFKKPVISRNVENNIHAYGMLVLLGLIVLVDILHIIMVGL